jgi:hypothetical protein
MRRKNIRSTALSQSNSVATPEYLVSDGFCKNSQTWDLAEGCVMVEFREDSSQP